MQKRETEINVTKVVEYWLETAKHDYKTMLSLYKTKRYSDSLFYGHIVLEKILKAAVTKNTGEHARLTHNLLVLSEDANLGILKEDINFLAEVNKFNIKARYPDYKLAFYKTCDKKYTKDRIKKIKKLYKKLCQKIES
jgi:HEPN domain-containing protein